MAKVAVTEGSRIAAMCGLLTGGLMCAAHTVSSFSFGGGDENIFVALVGRSSPCLDVGMVHIPHRTRGREETRRSRTEIQLRTENE
eukprot:scaffold923_cov171-Amphora_coffeaeformis.AAC.7